MASPPPVQLQIENDTTQQRRLFFLTREMSVTEPVLLALAAWKEFDLLPAGTTWAAYPYIPQLSAHILSDAGNHQTAFTDVDLGHRAIFSAGETPSFKVVRDSSVPDNKVVLENSSDAPVRARLLRDYDPLETVLLDPGATPTFEPIPELVLYSTVGITQPNQPLVLEPTVGSLDLVNRFGQIVEVKLFPDGAGIQWIFREQRF